MLNRFFFRLASYIKYLLVSENEHAVQAPFLFNLYVNVIKQKSRKSDFSEIEYLRNDLLKSEILIEVKDLGAKGEAKNIYLKKVKDIANASLSNFKKASLQHRLARYFKPSTIIELGTSLGITTLYLQNANPLAQIYTLEGAGEVSRIANHNFNALNINNINCVEGNFEETFLQVLNQLGNPLDYVYFDGNHRFAPTIRYFETALPFIHEKTIFVFDDIHWSPEMEKAWVQIIASEKVTVSIDLYDMGIIFFSKSLSKQNFVLRY